MKRCVLLIPDAGPLNSLWVADQLDLLLCLDMPIVIVDAVYDEVTGDPRYPKDAEVKAFIDGHRPPFVIERTDVGAFERERRRAGKPPKRNVGELAMMDFISEDGGVRRYLDSGEPLLVLFEDRGLRVLSKPPNMHLLSTVGLLRGLERVGLIPSADAVIGEMTNPLDRGDVRKTRFSGSSIFSCIALIQSARGSLANCSGGSGRKSCRRRWPSAPVATSTSMPRPSSCDTSLPVA